MRIGRFLSRNMITAAVFLGASTTPALAVDLTGTWEGKAVCTGFFNGAKFKETFPGNVLITQSGGDLNMEFLGVRYNGGILNDAKQPDKKGEGAFVACSTVAQPLGDYNETGHLKVQLTLNKSTFKATSVFMVGSLGSLVDVATCKWTFARTDTANPGVPECGGGSGALRVGD